LLDPINRITPIFHKKIEAVRPVLVIIHGYIMNATINATYSMNNTNTTSEGGPGVNGNQQCKTGSLQSLYCPVPFILAILVFIVVYRRPSRGICTVVYLFSVVVCIVAICLHLSIITEFVLCTPVLKPLWILISKVIYLTTGCGKTPWCNLLVLDMIPKFLPVVTFPILATLAYTLSLLDNSGVSHDAATHPRDDVVDEKGAWRRPNVISYGGGGSQERERDQHGQQYHLNDSTNGTVVFGDLGTINFNHTLPMPEVRRNDYDTFQRRAKRCP
jgi:hypothetical protein